MVFEVDSRNPSRYCVSGLSGKFVLATLIKCMVPCEGSREQMRNVKEDLKDLEQDFSQIVR